MSTPGWTIRRTMAAIAMLAPLLALARYPFLLGLAIYLGTLAWIAWLGLARRHHGLLAWLLILYPALPLLILHIHWALATRRIVTRSSPLFEGLIGLSDACGILCLLAYVGCVSILAGGRARDDDGLRRATRLVVILMPIAWAGLFGLAIWDPSGVLGYFFR